MHVSTGSPYSVVLLFMIYIRMYIINVYRIENTITMQSNSSLHQKAIQYLLAIVRVRIDAL